ncbi:hypothetical protein Nepgr_022767 [Nepenthes gracilis]|uniref:Uncharacterized protein n=1 Tax=Nepenthes gracilis TaxID=150966 RepID=A0AAD3XYG6_NEPGR|nr:hypothetical protein Nepgr_022767 [Nepenthes gracilis]
MVEIEEDNSASAATAEEGRHLDAVIPRLLGVPRAPLVLSLLDPLFQSIHFYNEVVFYKFLCLEVNAFLLLPLLNPSFLFWQPRKVPLMVEELV